eukprot:NODE_1678_length_794_cov_147.387919_g1305_i0.p4 GENE.NODE_1678_length_794_cov_147.387919_g1305_i0~~NODE_1678_length_794_cov_147.387919_g1305_i0.p4  ORF type:complete len:60 (+),score=23.49 NODE_1678_length_794_cov_147.387919_g1305_i0:283-462(+)
MGHFLSVYFFFALPPPFVSFSFLCPLFPFHQSEASPPHGITEEPHPLSLLPFLSKTLTI